MNRRPASRSPLGPLGLLAFSLVLFGGLSLLGGCYDPALDSPTREAETPDRAAETDPPEPLDADALDRWVQDAIAEHRIPGMAVMVVQDGSVLYETAQGLDDLESGTPFTTDTWARLASATKVITSLVFLSAAEDGLIDLEAPLGTALPEAPEAWHEIPLWRLLNHTAGLPMALVREDFQAMTDAGRAALTHREVFDWLRNEPLDFPPGERSRYQQSGYSLLAMILGEVTHKSWPELVDEHVTRPAGLEATRYGDSLTATPINYRPIAEDSAANDATAESQAADESRPAAAGYERNPFFYPPVLSMGGGWNTTANDLRRLFAALDRGAIVSNDFLERQVFDPEHVHAGDRDAEGEGYSLATIVKQFGSTRTIGHSGGGGLADVRYAPEERIGIAVLTNLGATGVAIELTDEISRRLFGPDATASDAAAPDPPASTS